jgi:hypothetical protein
VLAVSERGVVVLTEHLLELVADRLSRTSIGATGGLELPDQGVEAFVHVGDRFFGLAAGR